MNILIGLPCPDSINPTFAFNNLHGIISHTKENLQGLGSINIAYQAGVRTDRNRNYILHRALEQGQIDYILWLDTDMLYPNDIICKYMEKDFDVIGCLYFKRAEPYDTVAYVKGNTPGKYTQLDPTILPKDEVIEVDGIGYGGMMVNIKLYERMGENKWTKYSDNFHLPYETETPKYTHDFVFCQDAQKHGAKILLHTGVRPGHLSEYVVTERDWLMHHNTQDAKEKIIGIMPTIHLDESKKTEEILSSRAGMDIEIKRVYDFDKKGFVWNCNEIVKNNKADYYVYLTDDIFPSRNWLKDGIELLKKKNGGLLGFNDGKWKGSLATCGILEAKWMKSNYNGNMFHPGYFGHYNDTELTLVAMQDDKYCYEPNISLIEVDYDKEKKSVHPKDKELFNERKKNRFDDMVRDKSLLEMFS